MWALELMGEWARWLQSRAARRRSPRSSFRGGGRRAPSGGRGGRAAPRRPAPGVGGEAMPLPLRPARGRDRDDHLAAPRERDRDPRPGCAAGARARHPAHARRRQGRPAGAHQLRRRGARRLDLAVRVARRPLRRRASSPSRPRCGPRSWPSPAGYQPVPDGDRARGCRLSASARIPISPSLIADQYPIGVRAHVRDREPRPSRWPRGRTVPRRCGVGVGGRRRRLALGDGRGRDPGARRGLVLLSSCASAAGTSRGRSRPPARTPRDPPVRLSAAARLQARSRPSVTSSSASACSGSRS